jgi:hypothetical protein
LGKALCYETHLATPSDVNTTRPSPIRLHTSSSPSSHGHKPARPPVFATSRPTTRAPHLPSPLPSAPISPRKGRPASAAHDFTLTAQRLISQAAYRLIFPPFPPKCGFPSRTDISPACALIRALARSAHAWSSFSFFCQPRSGDRVDWRDEGRVSGGCAWAHIACWWHFCFCAVQARLRGLGRWGCARCRIG